MMINVKNRWERDVAESLYSTVLYCIVIAYADIVRGHVRGAAFGSYCKVPFHTPQYEWMMVWCMCTAVWKNLLIEIEETH
jgi:hypothetical protein